MPTAAATAKETFRAPGPADRADLRWLAARWHVATTDAEVEAEIRARLAAAGARAGKRPARGERTIRAWVAAALREHRANRALFAAVARPGRDAGA